MFNLTPKPDYKKIEKEVLNFWRDKKIFEKSVALRSPKKRFVFYEGPPTANGKPGIHHMLARAFKDVMCRYKTMQGFQVLRQAGWDTHGLPVEIEIEKKLGISGKDQIECLVPSDRIKSIERFNQLCRESVFEYQKVWEKSTERLGYWVDMENPYITYKNEYIEKLWGIIKQIWDKGLLYEGHKVVPYCYRCGTALSSHEVAQEYRDVEDMSVFVKFQIVKNPDTYFLVWTTTPWTLLGNVALAVGKEIEYVKVAVGNEKLILAKNLAEKVLKGCDFKAIATYTGKDFLSEKYQPIFKAIPLKHQTKDIFSVVAGDFVSTDEGTGIVHTAVMYGEDDYNLAQKFDLPKFHIVNKQGNFIKRLDKLAGKNVHSANPEIIEMLEKSQVLFAKQKYKHSYPFCWRCHKPLIYYATNSWFIKMSALRKKLLENNADINWEPEHLKNGRFGNWLEEVKDWAFSRERYWATPLPVWRCQTGKIKNQKSKIKNGCNYTLAIGSFEELANLSTQPIDMKNFNPHRPYIDEIKLKCPKCSGEMIKDPAVIDVWFDSGAMPFASGAAEKIGFPADYICEAIDQTRGWFYTLLAIATLLDKGPAYKNVISLGHILDEHGKKMSKTLGNIIDPNEIIDEFGADSLRFYLFTVNQAGATKRFVKNDLIVSLRRNLMMVWNITSFFHIYSKAQKWSYQNSHPQHFLDQWLAAKIQSEKKAIAKELDNYKIVNAAWRIEKLINEFSTWYLRLSRKRKTPEFFDTFYAGLIELLKLIAPFMPFVSEYLYQRLRSQKDAPSIHLRDFGAAQEFNQDVLNVAEKMKDIINQAMSVRMQVGIKVRQPLAKLELKVKNLPLNKEMVEIIAQETNVLEVKVKQAEKTAVVLDTKITPVLAQMGRARELKRQIQNLRKKAGYKFNEVVELRLGFDIQNNWIKKYFPELEKDVLVKIVGQIESPDASADLGDFKIAVFSADFVK
ncbi:MAG: isoleucyl-tRNA synthetase [Candidatus Berkelbacteria bacterium Licking1014_7]|uniref:Isoleucine--tRNA ligase n=1 Tax=Candidatus Berkelbacteria bacterium Licking1014_7 TaxID=2017147 RepID=A0A554LHM8_9BACT|nr:MAG: isoleucyl-tRNA synthetase [Candidatus Berkelbacteria bacterium Licking1014_7]